MALAVQWLFFEGKMRALFSIMFGAGIVVFMQRATARDGSVTAADLYARRMLWLMRFGALHGWLIWHGDILYAYALCGLLLFPLRTLSPKALFITAAAGLILVQAFMIANGFRIRAAQAAAVEARAIESRGQALTDEQQEAKPAYFPPLFDLWAMMLLGMALFKMGILQGERPLRFYAGMALAGYGIGLPLNALSAIGMISSNFDLVSS